jgi:GGDEF domain-containing protein
MNSMMRFTFPRQLTELPGLRRGLLVAAAVGSGAGCLASALTGSLLGAAFAAITTVLVLTTLAVGHRRGSSADDEKLTRAAEFAETGRRLAIYERETGLLAHWYMTLRANEECERAVRYRRPLAILIAETAAASDPQAMQEQLPQWLRQRFRGVDIIGYLGNGRYVVLMPETDLEPARQAASRLLGGLGGVDVGLSGLPVDGTTFEELYAAAVKRLGQPIEQAA